jgi:hypothetical protein
MASIFPLDQLFDKDLYAKKVLNVRRGASTESPILYKTKPGQYIGKIYSYVQDKEGYIWLMVDAPKPLSGVVFVRYDIDNFNIQILKYQGAKTVTQLQEEKQKATEPWYAGLIKTGKIVLIGGLVVYTGVQVYKAYRSTK